MKNFWKALLAVIIMVIVAELIQTVIAQFSMSYYMDEAYFGLWSKLMMPEAGPPPASFMVYSVLSQLASAIIAVFVFYLLGSAVPGSGAKRGLLFGLLMFLVAGISSMLTFVLLLNIPFGLIMWWTLASLLIFLISGLFIGLLVAPRYELRIVEKTELEIK
ncbi:MAG TPA: hypothetical protein VMX18_00940 [Candidatus Bipolaricaulota bacterium]|nr:hypothetical protein [Candidatus Bipolaricaulota bacterium]